MSILVVGLQGSPRRKGNSAFLLARFLEAAASHGAQTVTIEVDRKHILPCKEYTVCEKRGICPIEDDVLHEIYPLIRRADIVVAATPVFFYNLTAQLKALIDRCQLFWARKYRLRMRDTRFRTKKLFLLSVAATHGKTLFDAIHLTMNYFGDAIDAAYAGHLVYRDIEGPKDMARHATVAADIEAAVADLVKPLTQRPRVLFAGRHDAGRGPMAAAFTRILAGGKLEAVSGGTVPAEQLRPEVVSVMGEAGWDLAYEAPADLARQLAVAAPEVAIALDQAVALPALAVGQWRRWDLPADVPPEASQLRALRDTIMQRVQALVDELAPDSAGPAGAEA